MTHPIIKPPSINKRKLLNGVSGLFDQNSSEDSNVTQIVSQWHRPGNDVVYHIRFRIVSLFYFDISFSLFMDHYETGRRGRRVVMTI